MSSAFFVYSDFLVSLGFSESWGFVVSSRFHVELRLRSENKDEGIDGIRLIGGSSSGLFGSLKVLVDVLLKVESLR